VNPLSEMESQMLASRSDLGEFRRGATKVEGRGKMARQARRYKGARDGGQPRHQKKRREDGHDVSCPYKTATVPDQAGAAVTKAASSRRTPKAPASESGPLA
jgi:hypothetical protein